MSEGVGECHCNDDHPQPSLRSRVKQFLSNTQIVLRETFLKGVNEIALSPRFHGGPRNDDSPTRHCEPCEAG